MSVMMSSNLAERRRRDGTVVMHDVVSVDGYIADDADNVGPLHG
jgi:hypothetical protein